MPRVMLYVQSLLGTGHLQRMALVARAAAAHGLAVDLVSGAPAWPGLDAGAARVVQLPPLSCPDDRFDRLVGPDGREADAALLAMRRDRLLAHAADSRPDVVVTETFPFGRRLMRFELLPLLDMLAALPRPPALVASIRDILATGRKPGRAEETVALLRRHYTAVLVHGDPALVGLEATFPLAGRIAGLLRYTGYVAPEGGIAAGGPRGREILVSGGGGPAGLRLLQAALQARRAGVAADRPWRLLAGHGIAAAALDALAAQAAAISADLVVERARRDFPALLARAALSVSACGYNTAIDLLRARPRAVLVPFVGGGETEQSLRAGHLAARGVARVVMEAALGDNGPAVGGPTVGAPAGGALGAAIAAALEDPPPPALALALDGATRSAEFLAELAAARERTA